MTRFDWRNSTFLLWVAVAAFALWFVFVGVHTTQAADDPDSEPPRKVAPSRPQEGSRLFYGEQGGPSFDSSGGFLYGERDATQFHSQGGFVYGERGGPKFDSRGGMLYGEGTTRFHTGKGRRDRHDDEDR